VGVRRALKQQLHRGVLLNFLVFVAVAGAQEPKMTLVVHLLHGHRAGGGHLATPKGGAEEARVGLAGEFLHFFNGLGGLKVLVVLLGLLLIDAVHIKEKRSEKMGVVSLTNSRVAGCRLEVRQLLAYLLQLPLGHTGGSADAYRLPRPKPGGSQLPHPRNEGSARGFTELSTFSIPIIRAGELGSRSSAVAAGRHYHGPASSRGIRARGHWPHRAPARRRQSARPGPRPPAKPRAPRQSCPSPPAHPRLSARPRAETARWRGGLPACFPGTCP
nr:hypothetical protein [Tanacetum cinerariifolium]